MTEKVTTQELLKTFKDLNRFAFKYYNLPTVGTEVELHYNGGDKDIFLIQVIYRYADLSTLSVAERFYEVTDI